MTLDRREWSRYCDNFRGLPASPAASARISQDGHVAVEYDGGALAEVDIWPHRDATDVRVGNVQILVGRGRVAVLMPRGPYPIQRWDVLWEGEIG